MAVALLLVPVVLSGVLRLWAVVNHTSTMGEFVHQMRDNAVEHAAVVGAVLVVLWIAGRTTHRHSAMWNLWGPPLGGAILTVAWLDSASDDGLDAMLAAMPAGAGWILLGLNTVALLRWWSIAKNCAPERP